MASTITREHTVLRRPRMVGVLLGLLAFLGVTALGGGMVMAFGLGGEEMALPESWLAEVPLIDSWVIPGLMLAVGFGLGSLLTAYGVWRAPRWRWARHIERVARHRWEWVASLAIGVGHVAWIGLELIYLPQPSLLQAVYGAVGIGLVCVPLVPAVSRHFRLT